MTTTGAIDWQAAPLGPGVTVLRSHPCGLAALAKPIDVLAHPNRASDRPRSLFTAPFVADEECFTWTDPDGTPRRAWLLHRLDSATSGVVLVAGNLEAATAVRAAFADRCVTKRYIAIVLGHPRDRRALWRDAMEVRRGPAVAAGRGARARAANRGGGVMAETAMRVVRLIPGPPALAVLELEPHTGRTHQLRHQCAKRRLPILGDQNYGNFTRNRELARKLGSSRLFLHAHSVQLEVTIADARVRFRTEAPVPPEFGRITGR